MIATLFVTFILLLACSFPIAVSQSFASMFLIFGRRGKEVQPRRR